MKTYKISVYYPRELQNIEHWVSGDSCLFQAQSAEKALEQFTKAVYTEPGRTLVVELVEPGSIKFPPI